jgi:hypothetical protein
MCSCAGGIRYLINKLIFLRLNLIFQWSLFNTINIINKNIVMGSLDLFFLETFLVEY